MIIVTCPNCQTRSRFGDERAGQRGRCGKCLGVIDIPPASAADALVSPPVKAADTLRVPSAGAAQVAAPAESAPAVTSAERNLPPVKAANTRRAPATLANDTRSIALALWIALAAGIGIIAVVGVLIAVFWPRGTREEARNDQPAVEEEQGPPSVAQPTTADKTEPVGADAKPPRTTPSTGPNIALPATTPAKDPGLSGGLVGMSGQYGDRDCQTIQARHGVAIPAAATMIEVDGRRLPLVNAGAWAAAPAPILPLPRGTHAVRFRPNEPPLAVTIRTDLISEYSTMREFFRVGGRADAERLLSRSARALDVHSAPYLLNFMGAMHAADDRGDAAARCFRRALCVNPAFAPAHLNLAECLARRQAYGEAQREVDLAEALNVGNVFGLAAAINQVRRQANLPATASAPIDCAALNYISAEPLTDDDRRVAALLCGISKYAVSDGERAKILNNLAVHFADTGRPERALFHFREALAAARDAGPERFALARRIFATMSEVCRKAGFAEADEYRRMQSMVTP